MNIENSSEEALINGHFSGGGFAFYRVPGTLAYTFTAQHDVPFTMTSFAELKGLHGVVVAPFILSDQTPLVCIRPDVLTEKKVPLSDALQQSCESMNAGVFRLPNASYDRTNEGRASYNDGFGICLDHLKKGSIRKVVYSRRQTRDIPRGYETQLAALFFEACRRQPNHYVSLWWTPQTGCWLVATPETLLADDDMNERTWQTMALAGTMPSEPQNLLLANWSEKNKKEQAYVSAFISQRLEQLVDEMNISPVFPSPAANVIHLRTDFSFKLKNEISPETLLDRLHPTPAVCGEPQIPARSVISMAETTPRRYYAGFSGPFSLVGNTRLYVSLRCMELFADRACLYAGGGLLSDSNEAEEWKETCRKLKPMEELIQLLNTRV